MGTLLRTAIRPSGRLCGGVLAPTLAGIVLFASPARAAEPVPGPVVVNEVQTGGPASGGD